MDEHTKEQIERICREVLAPLIRTDGGEMHLVSCEGDQVHVHLSSACAGCPGAAFTADKVVQPALALVAPNVRLLLTTGFRIPGGARKLS